MTFSQKAAEKPADSKPSEPDKVSKPVPATGSKEADTEVAKEGLVKPSSFKRPRLPSGTPPKPAPRPDKKDSRKESKEEKKEEKREDKPEVKKEVKPEEKVEAKPEIAKEGKLEEKKEVKPEEKKEEKPVEKGQEQPDGKKEEPEEEKAEKVEEKEKIVEVTEKVVESLSVEEGKKKEEQEDMKTKSGVDEEKEHTPSEGLEEPTKKAKQKVEDVLPETEVSKGVESREAKESLVGNTENVEVKEKDGSESAVAKDDSWVSRETGKEALRPGGRSASLKMQRSTSGTEKTHAPAMRSATLPKPWSPGQAPSNMLSRKLSWELPKAGEEDARRTRKERSASSSDVPIPEVSEDQSSKP